MRVLGRLLFLVMALALSAAVLTHGAAASKMSLEMAASTQIEGGDDCSACGDGELGALATCQSVCGGPIVAIGAAPSVEAPQLASDAHHPARSVGLHTVAPGHDPYPPRSIILA